MSTPVMSGDEHIYDVIVVGGGQSGLATGYYLRRHKLDFLILDDQDSPGGGWRHVWDSMTLFSTAEFSNLPGIPMPHYDGFPPASHVIDYLAAYEARYELPVRRPVRVERVGREGGLFVVVTDQGVLRARCVIAATGTWSAPFVPTYPGRFHGRQWHSANYPGPAPFAGQSVAVVGGANSGAQIAAELANSPEVGPVVWYTLEPPRWMPDDIDGRELFRRNRGRALAILRGEPDPGPDSLLGDIVMLPSVKEARDSGRLRARPMFASLKEVYADNLIWCTGFRPALGPFRRLVRGRAPLVEGLYFVGYGDWVGPGAATITGVGPYAKKAAADAAAFVRMKR